tara:strand:- start:15608 stop:16078 length:471 start_codon:yes stop_codon:yes gene_type:complete
MDENEPNETNVVDLLLKRMEIAPKEFFSMGEMIGNQIPLQPIRGRDVPPFLPNKWARVIRTVQYAASDEDWERLDTALRELAMQAAEATFYNAISPPQNVSGTGATLTTHERLRNGINRQKVALDHPLQPEPTYNEETVRTIEQLIEDSINGWRVR